MNQELDKVLHQPIRTRIAALLVNEGSCEYNRIKLAIGLSDGHMSTHMKELVACGYVDVKKEFIENKPRTTYYLTKDGKKRFAEYVRRLKEILTPRY